VYAAAVQLDDVADDGEPEAQAPAFPAGGGIRLAEALEHVGQEFGRDANSSVRDADLGLPSVES
jgi:hypothetical protein